jgi:hypothetical protein
MATSSNAQPYTVIVRNSPNADGSERLHVAHVMADSPSKAEWDGIDKAFDHWMAEARKEHEDTFEGEFSEEEYETNNDLDSLTVIAVFEGHLTPVSLA